MKPMFLFWLFASVVAFLSAATASRTYVTTNNIAVLVLAMALFTVGNLMVINLMRESGMGLAVSLVTIAQLMLVNVIAYAVFGERMSAVQIAGVALGVVSMVLMLLPMRGRS